MKGGGYRVFLVQYSVFLPPLCRLWVAEKDAVERINSAEPKHFSVQ